MDTKPYEVAIASWDELYIKYDNLSNTGKQWIFRGQECSKWRLETSLERAVKSFEGDYRDMPQIESKLLRRFKRQCQHYTLLIPEEDDTLEWLALMQHYGAPTRLLDWTYSFFVAVYFALEDAEKECAVWAINSNWMEKPFEAVLTQHKDVLRYWKLDRAITQRNTFKRLFMRGQPITLVGAVNPYRLNERLVIQQGVFLCHGDVSKPFEDNLEVLLSKDAPRWNVFKFKIIVSTEERKRILRHLHRMNMNRATLFPGLDGFSRSLRTLTAFPDIL